VAEDKVMILEAATSFEADFHRQGNDRQLAVLHEERLSPLAVVDCCLVAAVVLRNDSDTFDTEDNPEEEAAA
jgi:hypothetical protein